jgi:hypothetical protein
MLEQAVIDAQSLKEAAIKNAEREILEKYSSDVKQAVDALLEQDEMDPMAGMANNEPDEMIDDINLKATEGETACPCPDEQEVVTIDLSGIVDALRDEPEEEEVDMSAMAEPAPEGEELETDLEALAEMLDLEEKLSDKQEKVMDQDKDGDIDEKDLEALRAKKKETNEEVELKEEELDEDIELTEENILEIMEDILSEKLTVDMSVEARR